MDDIGVPDIINLQTQTQAHIYMHIYIYVCTKRNHAYTYERLCLRAHTNICMHTYVDTYNGRLIVYICMFVYICIFINSPASVHPNVHISA